MYIKIERWLNDKKGVYNQKHDYTIVPKEYRMFEAKDECHYKVRYDNRTELIKLYNDFLDYYGSVTVIGDENRVNEDIDEKTNIKGEVMFLTINYLMSENTIECMSFMIINCTTYFMNDNGKTIDSCAAYNDYR